MKRSEFTPKTLTQARQRAKGRCEDCGASKALAGHHVVPAWRGGTNSLANCIMLCAYCHILWDRRHMLLKYQERNRLKIRDGTKQPGKIASRGFDKRLTRRFDGTTTRKLQ